MRSGKGSQELGSTSGSGSLFGVNHLRNIGLAHGHVHFRDAETHQQRHNSGPPEWHQGYLM